MLTTQPCLACQECVEVCPVQAIAIEPSSNGNLTPTILWDTCNRCLECIKVCVTGTLSRVGRQLSAREVLETIRLDQPFFDRSGGGVTLSGGEPTAQAEFARAILEGCKRLGLHTAVETSGVCDWQSLAKLLPFTDLVFFDLKHLDPHLHQRYTGRSNEQILHNLRRMAREFEGTIIRVPIIPGHNDDDEHLRSMAAFVASLERKLDLELIPFHQLGSVKYQRLGRSYALHAIPPAERDYLLERKAFLQSFGLQVI